MNSSRSLPRRHRPLGDILLERRLLSPEQLRDALALQQRRAFRGRYLGELLVETAVLTQDQVQEALAIQRLSKVLPDAPEDELDGTAPAESAARSLSIPGGIAADPIARQTHAPKEMRVHRSAIRSYHFAGASQNPHPVSVPERPEFRDVGGAAPEIASGSARQVSNLPEPSNPPSNPRRFKLLHTLMSDRALAGMPDAMPGRNETAS
jgi:hypothetical protein